MGAETAATPKEPLQLHEKLDILRSLVQGATDTACKAERIADEIVGERPESDVPDITIDNTSVISIFNHLNSALTRQLQRVDEALSRL